MQNGWLAQAKHCPSPNFNARPATAVVDLLVIHNISLPPGEFGSGHVQQFFANQLDCSAHRYYEEIRELKVSAHFLIERHGQLTQFVAMTERAWHAGRSCFQGRSECNDYSIGVELEGVDDLAYTAEQYRSLVELSALIMHAYPGITPDRIVGHCDIAPDRKTDPGASFDWHAYRCELSRYLEFGRGSVV